MKNLVYVSRHSYMPVLQVYFRQDNGRLFFDAQPLIFKEEVPNAATEPCMTIDPDTAQQFMDQLWTCGIRPSNGTGSTGQLAATERHLGDMKTIAFGLLKKHGVDG